MESRNAFIGRLIGKPSEQKSAPVDLAKLTNNIEQIAARLSRQHKTIMITGDEEMGVLNEMAEQAQLHSTAWFVIKREIRDPDRLYKLLKEIISRLPAEAGRKSPITELGIPVKVTTKAMQAVQKAANKPRGKVLGIPVKD